MEAHDEHIDLFERYQRGELSATEKSAFIERLNADADFKAEFDAFQLVIESLQASRSRQLSDELKRIREEEHEDEFQEVSFSLAAEDPAEYGNTDSTEPTGRTRRLRTIVGVAAAMVALIVLAQFIRQSSLEELLPIEHGLPVRMNQGGSAYDEAMNAYKQEDYIMALEQLQAMRSSSDTNYYFRGVMYLKIEEFSRADSLLALVPSQSAFSEKAIAFRIYLAARDRRASDALELLELLEKRGVNLTDSQAELLESLRTKE
jgi:anti-sigma-K factor RskA